MSTRIWAMRTHRNPIKTHKNPIIFGMTGNRQFWEILNFLFFNRKISIWSYGTREILSYIARTSELSACSIFRTFGHNFWPDQPITMIHSSFDWKWRHDFKTSMNKGCYAHAILRNGVFIENPVQEQVKTVFSWKSWIFTNNQNICI